MAALKENLLSLGHMNGSEKTTFTKQREFCGNKSVNMAVLLQDDSSALHSQEHLVMHLQQRWQELKEREYTAQQQNRQLLQQFEKAQDTLKEMLARNAAMKIIRMEYERYLEENSPRWQQQLKEKTQAAQKKVQLMHSKKLDDYLTSCLQNAEVMKSSVGPPTKPQKPIPTPKGYSDYNQDSSSDLLHTQSSWLTHSQSQTARFPTRVPQSFLQPPIIPHPYPLHYPASTPGHYHPWPRQDLRSWASPHPDCPWSQPSGTAGTPSYSEALWGQLCVEEPSRDSRVSQIVGEENKMSRAVSSQRERSLRSSSSRLSNELDVKPVRLSSSHCESSESDRDSSVASREKRKKEIGGRKQRASSDRETCSSQELSGNSSAIPVPSVAVAQSSESNASSEKSSRCSSRRTKRSGGLSVRSTRSEKVAEEKTRGKGDDSESQHTGEESGSSSEAYKSEKAGTQSHDEKSDRCKESGSQREKESESDNVKNENDDAGDVEEQESSSSEQSSTEEKVEDEREKNLEAEEDGEEKENSQTDKEQDDSDKDQSGDDVSAKKQARGEEADTSIEDEMEEQGDKEQPTRLKNEGTENRKQGSASSQDEEEGSEGSEEEENEESNEQEDGESEKEEEHRSEEDEIDSDDCIITTQEKRSKQMQIISEEAAQEQEEGKTGSCNDDSNEVSDEDDVENLLAPQEQTQKKETDVKAQEKPKGSFHNMGIFQVEHDRSKTEDPNNSDEFDHFYD